MANGTSNDRGLGVLGRVATFVVDTDRLSAAQVASAVMNQGAAQ